MAKTDEKVMKKTMEKHKKQVMDGGKDGEPKPDEVKSGKKLKRPKATHLKTPESVKRKSGEMEGATEKSRTGEQKDGERKKEKGRDVSGDGEKRGRTGSGDENGQDVEESRVIKKSRGHEDGKNVRVWTVSYSSTVDLVGADKNIKPGTHRRERDEMEKCGPVQTLSAHRETDRKKSREARDQRDESSDAEQCKRHQSSVKP
ncbi:hypothetical protein PHYPO_G00075700 [Pangasianodon hypophthalmus]|uniref:Uncharacterized protein n=1 Tax=Pangasianodon hypophthalmus TaxID=310915 RepID=A0A5N5LV02_PANHP|nr:hypothetical protein PHYPO_G00075700 [Pangasianodon hypophthalmus]